MIEGITNIFGLILYMFRPITELFVVLYDLSGQALAFIGSLL